MYLACVSLSRLAAVDILALVAVKVLIAKWLLGSVVESILNVRAALLPVSASVAATSVTTKPEAWFSVALAAKSPALNTGVLSFTSFMVIRTTEVEDRAVGVPWSVAVT